MAIDESEHDDALQRWLKANWPALVAGVVIGLLALGGWRYWTYHQVQQAKVASLQYGKLLDQLGKNDIKSAAQTADRLQSSYGGTPYAAQADLAVAGYLASKGQYHKAAERLHWVAQNASDADLKRLARLREARALWGSNQSERALKLLGDDQSGPYLGLFQALKGDILASQHKDQQAREAYEMALQNLSQDAPEQSLIQHKLDDLSGAKSS